MPKVRGKKAKDSGKNEPHGDGGRAKTKAEKQIEELMEKLAGAKTRKEKKKLKQKIKNIRENAQRAAKGDTDHIGNTRP